MDRSPQSASSISDDFNVSLPTQQEDGDVEEAEQHIHMPNPSYWPLLLSIAIALTLGGLLFVSTAPWIPLIALPFVLIFILGWALEDPMAPVKEVFVRVNQIVDPWKFKIGQNVVDA